MADLTFSQPAPRNLAVPILLAVAVLVVAAVLVFYFTPHTTADVTVKKTAVYAAHTVFKSESTIVGRDPVQDDLYVLVTLHIDNRLRLPLFLKDFTATLTPSSNPDGTPAEDVTATAIEKLDVPNLYTSFPALKTIADQQATPLLLRDTQIDPGKSAEGLVLLHFPTTQAAWDQRKSATLNIALYHQQPLTIDIPKTKPSYLVPGTSYLNMTRRRFIADNWTATTATLTGDQAIHLARVLRAEPGQVYDVVANGFLHRAEITSVSAGGNEQEAEVLFALYEELESEASLPLHLLLAIFKFDHLEWAIEKATELGVAKITPILARRTEKHLALAAARRVERWRRIALEASKQSRRTDIPTIADPTPLKLALEQETSPTRILLSETEQATTLSTALSDAGTTTKDRVPHPSQSYREGWDVNRQIALAIGPEGGWTPEEMTLFTQHQWQHVTLGPRILRAETAAIAAIAIASTHLS